MEKGITFLNKTISGFWWFLLFICTIIISALKITISLQARFNSQSTIKPLAIPLTIFGGFLGIVLTLLGALLFAAILKGTAWLARLTLPYTIFLRITIVYILLNVLFGLLPYSLLQGIITNVASSLYLSIAIYAAVPQEQRKPWVFIIGLLPFIFIILYTITTQI